MHTHPSGQLEVTKLLIYPPFQGHFVVFRYPEVKFSRFLHTLPPTLPVTGPSAWRVLFGCVFWFILSTECFHQNNGVPSAEIPTDPSSSSGNRRSNAGPQFRHVSRYQVSSRYMYDGRVEQETLKDARDCTCRRLDVVDLASLKWWNEAILRGCCRSRLRVMASGATVSLLLHHPLARSVELNLTLLYIWFPR